MDASEFYAQISNVQNRLNNLRSMRKGTENTSSVMVDVNHLILSLENNWDKISDSNAQRTIYEQIKVLRANYNSLLNAGY